MYIYIYIYTNFTCSLRRVQRHFHHTFASRLRLYFDFFFALNPTPICFGTHPTPHPTRFAECSVQSENKFCLFAGGGKATLLELALEFADLCSGISVMMQCGAVWCSVVQCGAKLCSVLQCVAVCCSVLQGRLRCMISPSSSRICKGRVAACHCVAVCCSVLQCVAVCCSVLQSVAACCRVLQCVAVCCSALQCFAITPMCVHTAMPATHVDTQHREHTTPQFNRPA